MSDPTTPEVQQPATTVPPPPVLPEYQQGMPPQVPPAPVWPMIVIGVLGTMLGAFQAAMVIYSALLLLSVDVVDDAFRLQATGTLALVIAMSAGSLTFGIGLIARRNWARIGAVVCLCALLVTGVAKSLLTSPPNDTVAYAAGQACGLMGVLAIFAPIIWYLLSAHAKRACRK